jgi:integral membrane protein
MKSILNTQLGRLRVVSYLEGITLLLLLGVAVPLKHWGSDPSMVKLIGPVHGILFLLFIISTLSVGVEQQWKFKETTWKVLIACIIPFGTFYIDRHILKKAAEKEEHIHSNKHS